MRSVLRLWRRDDETDLETFVGALLLPAVVVVGLVVTVVAPHSAAGLWVVIGAGATVQLVDWRYRRRTGRRLRDELQGGRP